MSELVLPSGRYLDLTDPEIRDAERVTAEELVGDDTTKTRALARRTRELGTHIGIRAPSAALNGHVTFVVFPDHVAAVKLVSECIVRIGDYLGEGAGDAGEASPE
jgi:RES domain-containing protein